MKSVRDHDKEQWLSYINFEPFIKKKKTFFITPAELDHLNNRGNYRHSKGNPSSRLSASMFQAIQTKYKLELDQKSCLEFTAHILGVSVQDTIDAIHRHEEYMRFHDGDYEYKILD